MESVFIVLGLMTLTTVYYLGIKEGKRVALQAVALRFDKVLKNLTWEERQSFNAALHIVIKEEKQRR